MRQTIPSPSYVQNELIVTSKPIELQLIVNEYAETVRIHTRELVELGGAAERIARDLQDATAEVQKQVKLAMQDEPELDRG